MKQLLMDQKFVSGLGNIYSDEVLFAAGLRYDRPSDTLSSQEVRRLYRAMQEVLQEAIRFRGTTLEDEAYLDLFGKPGEFQSELRCTDGPASRPPLPNADSGGQDLRAERVLLSAVPVVAEAATRGRRRRRSYVRARVARRRCAGRPPGSRRDDVDVEVARPRVRTHSTTQ